MFSSDSPHDLKNLLIQTLQWESFEQQAVWRLLFSHENIPIESWVGILPALCRFDLSPSVRDILNNLAFIVGIMLKRSQPSNLICETSRQISKL